MQPVVVIQSAESGVLMVNGQFCGPLEEGGQSFPAGRDAEIYVQLFPFGEERPLTAGMTLRDGRVARLEPADMAYALCWPDGVIQLELRGERTKAQEAAGEQEAAGVLVRYLQLRLAGDPRAERLLLNPVNAPELAGYEAAVMLRCAPADPRYDERAGLVRRAGENVAVVDAAMARTVYAGPGIRRIERLEIVRARDG